MEKVIIKNALILSEGKNNSSTQDIYIEAGIIKEIADTISTPEGCAIVDVEGAYVSAGWVDAHTHVDWEAGQPGLDPAMTYASDGLTFVVDAGTDGPANYTRMHEKIKAASIEVKSYLNVAQNGISVSGHELTDLDLLDAGAFYKTYEQYKDEIIGVKIRIDPRVNADILKTLEKSREIADRLGLPMIVHPSRCTEPLEKILPFFRRNDVFAHTYSALDPCILDEHGQVKNCVWEAQERGVWFDLSHGSSNFSFDVAAKAMEQGFVVDTISTDLHTMNLTYPVRSMADVMTKMLYLGMSLEEIIEKVTSVPIKMLRIKHKSGSIVSGKKTDLTVFRVSEGKYALNDSCKKVVTADRRIDVVMTMLGKIIHLPRRCPFYVN